MTAPGTRTSSEARSFIISACLLQESERRCRRSLTRGKALHALRVVKKPSSRHTPGARKERYLKPLARAGAQEGGSLHRPLPFRCQRSGASLCPPSAICIVRPEANGPAPDHPSSSESLQCINSSAYPHALCSGLLFWLPDWLLRALPSWHRRGLPTRKIRWWRASTGRRSTTQTSSAPPRLCPCTISRTCRRCSLCWWSVLSTCD